jgi:hypothetical protein
MYLDYYFLVLEENYFLSIYLFPSAESDQIRLPRQAVAVRLYRTSRHWILSGEAGGVPYPR